MESYPIEWFVIPFDHHLDVGSTDKTNESGVHRWDRISLLVGADHAHFVLGRIATCKKIPKRGRFCKKRLGKTCNDWIRGHPIASKLTMYEDPKMGHEAHGMSSRGACALITAI